MNKPIPIYDKTGRLIKPGDMIEMFHYTGKYGRKAYMYKMVRMSDHVPQPFLMGVHFPFTDAPSAFFMLQNGADKNGVLSDCEIVASTVDYFVDRKRKESNENQG